MADATGVLARSRIDATGFEPLVVDGQDHGLVHWVRNDVRSGHEYRAAVWVMPQEQLPYSSPYTFHNDETFTILQGELQITWADGTVDTLVEGDIISVAAGTTSDWLITVPFKKFVVEVQL